MKVNIRVVYPLTIPERMLRAMAAVLGGVVFVLSDVLVPQAIQRTTIYYLLLGGGMRFAVERLAGMSTQKLGTDELVPLPERYQRRKLVGTAIEAAGLLTVGFSPLWVFAIAGDAAAGSKVFLHRLEQHLKRQGAIADDAEVTNLTDLLEALQRASRAMTTVLDTPPLSRGDLEELSRQLRSSYSDLFSGSRDLSDRLEQLWERMDRLSDAGAISLKRLDVLMASGAISRLRRGRATLSAVRATGRELFGEEILEGYRRTLEDAAERGWFKYLVSAYQPFWLAAQQQFSRTTSTSTGDLLHLLWT